MAIKRRKSAKKLKRMSKPEDTTQSPVDFFSSGSTTMNLALSGKAMDGGWARGRVLNLVGSRSSGKTAVALEGAFSFYSTIRKIKSLIWPRTKKFEIVYNNPEGVMDFNIPLMYGPKFYKKVIWMQSPTVEHFSRDYFRRVDLLRRGHSLLYIVDTLDFLRSYLSLERFTKSVKKDADIEGSYDTEKQKYLSAFFATTANFLKENEKDATLLVISQVRDKFGVVFGKKQTRTGGRAFDHAIHQEAWLQETKKLDAIRYGEKKIYAINSRVRVEKNKCAKPYREAFFRILYDYGIDDINSIIDYLWGNRNISFDGQTFKTRKKFVDFIESNNYENLLEEKAEQKWSKVEEAFAKEVSRRKRKW